MKIILADRRRRCFEFSSCPFSTQCLKLSKFFSIFNDFHYGIFAKKEYDVKETIELMQNIGFFLYAEQE